MLKIHLIVKQTAEQMIIKLAMQRTFIVMVAICFFWFAGAIIYGETTRNASYVSMWQAYNNARRFQSENSLEKAASQYKVFLKLHLGTLRITMRILVNSRKLSRSTITK